MRLGLLLNRKKELPAPIADLLTKLKCELDLKIYDVSNLIESVYLTSNVFFEQLVNVESWLTLSSIKYHPVNFDLDHDLTIDDMDAVLCWGTEYGQPLTDNTKLLYFYLNDERLDRISSGLKEILHEQSFELSIRCKSANDFVKTASMCCKPYHSLAKTKVNALNNICILLKKSLRGEIGQSPQSVKYVPSPPCRENSLLLHIMYNALKSKIEQRSVPMWRWDIHVGKSSDIWKLGEAGGTSKVIEHDQDRFWADPFLINYHGVNYIFLEEFMYKKRKGDISVLKQDVDGSYSYLGVVLDFQYHLSYPFIIEIHNTVYMIPETGSVNRIDLYKCIEFPLKWEYCRTLMHGYEFVDTTVFYHKDKFWLFTSAKKDGVNSDSQLLLYYCDNIISDDLIEHPLNPVVYGVDRSRMAGSIFKWQDYIIRPAQDCSQGYGGSIRFMSIEELTENSYSERQVDSLSPISGYRGTHTFNNNDDIYIIDTHACR